MLESAAADLPDDVESLRALLAESRLENHRLPSTLVYRNAQIEKLLLQLARLKRMQFGAKSEKLDREIEPLELLIEELQTPSTVPSRAPTDAAAEKAVPVRRPLAGTSAPGIRHPCAGHGMPELRRHATDDRRRRLRNARLCAGALEGDPACPAEVRL